MSKFSEQETLISDYLQAKGLSVYLPEGSLENVESAGEWVLCVERSECGYYNQNHKIALLAVAAWVHGGSK